MARAREPLRDRILRLHRKAGECWIWTGTVMRDGYGVMVVGRKPRRAHRIAFEAWHGPIPVGLLVCHHCDVPLCVNPEHLFLGTPKDNTADMDAKGRRVRATIATHPLYRTTKEDRETIRHLRREGLLLREIGKRYGIDFRTVSQIIHRSNAYAGD